MESEASLSAWAVARPDKGDVSPAVIAKNLTSAVGCHQAVAQSTAALVECLRTAPLEAILRSAETMFVRILFFVFRYMASYSRAESLVADDENALTPDQIESIVTSL